MKLRIELLLKLVLCFSLIAVEAGAVDIRPPKKGEHPYHYLLDQSDALSSEAKNIGWAYVVSGIAALGFSTPAYYLSEDVFAQTIYSVAQSLGVAAIGYGSYQLLIESESTRFLNVIKSVPSLKLKQKDQLALSFMRENAALSKNGRMIRLISHSLTAALNLSNAVTVTQPELQTALIFLTGINTLAALNFAFSSTDEEELIETFNQRYKSRRRRKKRGVKVSYFLGPISGVQFRF